MRKISVLLFAVVLSVFSKPLYGNVFDSLTNEIDDKLFGPVAYVVSQELAQHMGFYTGSGNLAWASPAPFPGLRTGLGAGVNMSQGFRQALNKDYSAFNSAGTNKNGAMANDLSAAIALFPFPYDMLYVKLGLPDAPLDIGLRAGYIPIPRVTSAGGVSFYANAFHLGAEGRYLIKKYFGDLISINGCASLDFNAGGLGVSYSNVSQAFVTNVVVGTNVAAMGMDIGWRGVSLGGKIIAALNIPVVGGIFTGLGLNFNIGSVSTHIYLDGTFIDLAANPYALELGKTVPVGYNFLDLRIFAGFQFFFVSFSMEYGLLNKDLALNLYPIALSF